MQLELEGISDEQCTRICEDYWRQNDEGKFIFKVRELAAMYELKPSSVSSLVSKHAYVWMDSIYCEDCKRSYRFRTRFDYQDRRDYIGRVCENCRENSRIKLESKKKIFIEEHYNKRREWEGLSLISYLYVVSAISALGDESLSTIRPLSSVPLCTLSPSSSYDKKIINHLISNELFVLKPGDYNKFLYVDEAGRMSLSYQHCEFELSISRQQVVELLNTFSSEKAIESAKQELSFFELCKDLQLVECLVFLKLMMQRYDFSFIPGEKTKQVINQCLIRFSVAQVCNFILRAAKDSAAYYVSGRVSKFQAANSVVGRISNNMERALANDWVVTPLSRNYKLPQSSLSRLVFNRILLTDDGGFKMTLEDLIKMRELGG